MSIRKQRRRVVTALVILFGVTLIMTFYGKQVPLQRDTVNYNDDDFSDFARNGAITQVSDTKVFIYSVIGRNTSTASNPWNEYGVSAWFHSELKPRDIACCYLLENGTIIQSNHTKYLYYSLDIIFTI
ncbi:hypothetical protein ACJMK2_018046 [Sinanodonta woodiana]|uniref:Uncharacterized protein n=1 Tax=Sinanodonta woodiana TaxID=1069815 RepID=A0ABD3UCA6_SINWO